MNERSNRARLNDILDNIQIIQKMLDGRTLETFTRDPVIRLAVERALEIVSEASRHVATAAQSGPFNSRPSSRKREAPC